MLRRNVSVAWSFIGFFCFNCIENERKRMNFTNDLLMLSDSWPNLRLLLFSFYFSSLLFLCLSVSLLSFTSQSCQNTRTQLVCIRYETQRTQSVVDIHRCRCRCRCILPVFVYAYHYGCIVNKTSILYDEYVYRREKRIYASAYSVRHTYMHVHWTWIMYSTNTRSHRHIDGE